MAALYISKKNGNVFQDTFYEANFKVNYIGEQLSGGETQNTLRERTALFDYFLTNHKNRTILTGRYIKNEEKIEEIKDEFVNKDNAAERVKLLEELYGLERGFISDLDNEEKKQEVLNDQKELREELKERVKKKIMLYLKDLKIYYKK